MHPINNNGKINTLQQGCTNLRCQVTMVAKFCVVVCNIWGSSQQNSLPAAILVPRLLR